MSRNLSPIEAAKKKVAMIESDLWAQEKQLYGIQEKITNTKEDLQIAKRDLAELEKGSK